MKAYPLHWPTGYKRTVHRVESRFKQTPGGAIDSLYVALRRLGASKIIVSSNAQLRQDGTMYADAAQRQADPGVAVYFDYKGKPVVLCADKYERIWENVYAIGRTIENLRTIERDGVSDFLDRSFTGFTALPEAVQTPYKKPWWEVLGVKEHATEQEIKLAYKRIVRVVHPDSGGNAQAFTEVQQAYETALKRFV